MAEEDLAARRKRAGGWVIGWGLALIVAGVVAIVEPGAAALSAAIILAWVFIAAGVFELISAWHQRGHDGLGWKTVSGLLILALGVAMLVFPLASIASIALLIGAFLFASGVSSLMLAFKLRPNAGWGWVLFDGLLSIVLAILIASGWPQSSIEFVGILVGFCLISGGFWRVMLGRAIRAKGASAE